MTRIVGGAAGGRRIGVPPGSGTRPTADRVREALFSSLETEFGSFEHHRSFAKRITASRVARLTSSTGPWPGTVMSSLISR